MGKDYTCKYILEVYDNSGKHIHGENKKINLEKWVNSYIESLKIGGCNEHISLSLGYMPIPNKLILRNQKTGIIIDQWNAPMFMVI